jgi:hypothetical protein
VAGLYLDLLQRPIDRSGLNYWSGLLDRGVGRNQVVAMLENTTEYRQLQVQQAYAAYLHRPADVSGLAHFTQLLANGGTVELLAAELVGSPEYLVRAGGTSGGFLAALYQDALHRPLDSGAQAFFGQQLQAGAPPRQVAARIFAADEYQRLIVEAVYQRYLGRAADSAGLAHFLAQLRHGGRDEDVVAAVLGSAEFAATLEN